MNEPVDEVKRFDSEQALTYSGVLVIGLVGGLGAWTMQATPLFPPRCWACPGAVAAVCVLHWQGQRQ